MWRPDRRERARLSGDSRHLRGGEGGQDGLERVPQASQGTWIEGCPADHLGCLHWACRERRRVLSRGCLAKVCSALVSQHLQPRALDQGAGEKRRSRRHSPTTPSRRSTGGGFAPTTRSSASCARSGGARVSWARSLTVNPRSTSPPQGCATSRARRGRPRDI
jgi:hypothetical protein